MALRLTHCPRCGYDIAALPPRHRCPECGFAYDESMFLLEGWRLPDLRSSARDVLRYGVALLAILAVGRTRFGWSFGVMAAILALALIVVAALYWHVRRRSGTSSRALVRYLITADGVARAGRRGGRIYLWRNYSHLMLLRDGPRGWRVHLYPAWWRLFGPPIVNARLDCDDAGAEALRAEMQRRINAARAAEAEEEGTEGLRD
ncbi:MAG: hypothetical protein ACYS0G_11565 [Planctomycetota bacterium]|jgi:hypothetical protein